MQNKNDIHFNYEGSDTQVLKLNKYGNCLERVFASEMTHDIKLCREIHKDEVIALEVGIYGKNKRDGDFKLIIEPARNVKTDNLAQNYVIEPPCYWIGNSQRGVFSFSLKLENEKLLLKMDDDKDWFTVLYFPKTVNFYNMKLSLCKTIRTVLIRNFYREKRSESVCSCK